MDADRGRRFVVRLSLLALLLPPPTFAADEPVPPAVDPPSLETSAFEKSASEKSASEKSASEKSASEKSTSEKSTSEKSAAETSSEPDGATVTPAPGNPEELSLELRDGSRYTLSPSALAADLRTSYDGMDPSERQQFLRNRELVLRSAGRLLHALRTPLGAGRKLGIRYGRARHSLAHGIDRTIDALGALAGYGPRSRFRIAGEKSDEQKEAELESLRRSLRENGGQAVETMLQRLDAELWAHAPFFARINETGLSLEAGVAGGAKAGSWGLFLITGTGISFTIDPKERAFVIEVYQDIEWTRRALPGYAGVEAFGSAFFTANYHDWNEPLKPEGGSALSLPGVAGCITRNNARVGVAKGIGVGFPGAAALESSIVRVPLLRIGLSPRWTGGVRAKFLGSHFITGPLSWCAEQLRRGCAAVYSLFLAEK